MKIFILLYTVTALLYSANLRDTLDRNVTYETAERLVALGPGALRLMCYMRLQSQLVGIERIELKATKHAPYRTTLHPENLPIIGQGGAGKLPDFEALINAKPDVILTSFLSREQIELIETKTHIPVIALSYGSSYGGEAGERKLDAITRSLTLLGTLTRREARAKALLAFMDKQRQSFKALGLEGRRAYIAGLGYKGAQGITSTESDYLPFEMLGVKNALELEGAGHRFIKDELLIKSKPKYLFIDTMGKGIVAQERKQKPWLFKLLEKNGHFWSLPASNYYNANIENLFVNAWLIADAMGADVNASSEAQAVYKMFLGADATFAVAP